MKCWHWWQPTLSISDVSTHITGLYTHWHLDPQTSKFTPRQNMFRSFETLIKFYFQRTRPNCKVETFYTTGKRKNIDCFSVDSFCYYCNTAFEALGCYHHFCFCEELRPCLTEEDIKRGGKKGEIREVGRSYIRESCFNSFEMCDCEWWALYKRSKNAQKHIRENFPHRRSLANQNMWEKNGKLFIYVQCQCNKDLPGNWTANFANFPPIFKETSVSKNYTSDLMKTYADEVIMSQPREMLISSVTLQNGTLITPLHLFSLELGLVCTKKYRFIENFPKMCFRIFVQSAVDARSQKSEKANSSVVAETITLLAKSAYGYQIAADTLWQKTWAIKIRKLPLIVIRSKN